MSVSLQSVFNCCGARQLVGVGSFAPDKKGVDEVLGALGKFVGCVFWVDNQHKGPKYTSEYPASMVFHKGGERVNGGTEWASAFRELGYRVDELLLGVNPNHPVSILTLYVLFLNNEEAKKPTRVREYVYGEETAEVRELGKPPGSGTREPIGGGSIGESLAQFRRSAGT